MRLLSVCTFRPQQPNDQSQERGFGTGLFGWLWSSAFTDWLVKFLQGSSSLTRSWHPRFTHSSTVYYTSHGGYQADPWSPMPYLECNLLLPRSWSTPLAIEALLICRPPSSLLPAVRATRSGSPRGGSCPFRSLRSRSACPSLPPRLFFSFPTTVSPSPLLL